jgi:uncharacterized protein YdhG (YjbR/CyaY superfamily)
MQNKAASVDEFLAPLSEENRAALEHLRFTIRDTEPELEEYINYGVPSYRYRGKYLLSFGAGAKHLAFYPGAYPVESLKDKLTEFRTSKGTIRFTPDKPIPDEVVREIVRLRVKERGNG